MLYIAACLEGAEERCLTALHDCLSHYLTALPRCTASRTASRTASYKVSLAATLTASRIASHATASHSVRHTLRHCYLRYRRGLLAAAVAGWTERMVKDKQHSVQTAACVLQAAVRGRHTRSLAAAAMEKFLLAEKAAKAAEAIADAEDAARMAKIAKKMAKVRQSRLRGKYWDQLAGGR